MIRGIFAFNGNVEHQKFVEKFLLETKVKYCIETGTLHGCTTAFFAERMPQVYTIEIKPTSLAEAQLNLDGYKNIEFICGNSAVVLPDVFGKIPSDERVLFFLDAHWEDYWPLFDELKAIQHIGAKAIIIIDDFKVPGKPYAYDTYKGIANCFEAVEPYLKKIYTEFTYEYFEGEIDHKLVLDEAQLNAAELKYYQTWYKGKLRRTTGKILIKEKI